MMAALLTLSAWGQTPPQLVSVTPTDGAADVAANSTIVFVFDQEMDTAVLPFGSLPGGIVGNFHIEPAGMTMVGQWGADKKTLTLRTLQALPADTLITWTLNPPGETFLPKLRSAEGVDLEAISGSFRTFSPGPPPQVELVTPADGAEGVSPAEDLVFVFDMEMNTNVAPTVFGFPVGNVLIEPVSVRYNFSASWVDEKTLRLRPAGLLGGTEVRWTLNPQGAATPLTSAEGGVLPAISGSYTVVENTGGNPNEICNMGGTGMRQLSIYKSFAYEQSSATEVDLVELSPLVFSAYVEIGPIRREGRATNASLAFPSGATGVMTNINSGFLHYGFPETEAEMAANYPPGVYTLGVAVAGTGEHEVEMEMPEALPPIPMIENYAEAQMINPAESFTLMWNEFAPLPEGAYVTLSILDGFGNLVFMAPNLCVPRELPSSAGSVEIPAHYLQPGQTYNATLGFGVNFHVSTNLVPDYQGFGFILRSTRFQIQASGEGGTETVPAATFVGYGISEEGYQMTVTGEPGITYVVEKAFQLDGLWTEAGTITMNAEGMGTFEEERPRRPISSFYRVVFKRSAE